MKNEHVVFTDDLDFGSILAATGDAGPSVLQVRCQDVSPDHLEAIVVAALRQYEKEFVAGALVVVGERTKRVRILPVVRVDEGTKKLT